MEKETKPVYVVTMAIYNENNGHLYTDVVDVFTNRESAEYALECALTNYINEVCDAHPEILPENTEPIDRYGQTTMDFSSVNGETAAFRIDEYPILERNRSFL